MRREGTVARVPGWALAGAAALHVLLFAIVVALPSRHPAPPIATSEGSIDDAAQTLSIEVDVAVASESPYATSETAPASSVPEAIRPSATARIRSGSPLAAVPLEAAREAPRAASGVTMGGWSPSTPTPAALGLDLGSPNRFAAPVGAVPEAPPSDGREERPRTQGEAKQAVEASLREPARKRERELGLGPEGPVLVAIRDSTSSSDAPVHGRAVLLAIADGTGTIASIDVIECDGARSGWTHAARLARAALKGKKLRLPSTARRAEMRIEVVSSVKMPSGHDPGADVTLFHVPVSKGAGSKSTKVAILDPIPKLRTVDVEIAPGVRIPIPQIEIDVLGLEGDPVDIGAKPLRVVHTHLLDSRVL